MPREIGSGKERLVGWLLVGGLVLMVVCGILTWMFSVAGVYRGTYTRTPITNQITDAGTLNLVPLTIAGMVIGLLMMLAGLGYAFFSMAKQNKGERRVVEHFQILSRYCYDKNQNLLTAEWDIEVAEKPKFYIRGRTPEGLVGEFETTVEVYFMSGEGMYGEAELQGQWLGRFVPYIGAPSGA